MTNTLTSWHTYLTKTVTEDLDEGDVTPELFQDESDNEIQLQPQQGAQNTVPTCVICMDRRPEVVLVPKWILPH